MRKEKLISCVTFMVGVMMISIGIVIQSQSEMTNLNTVNIEEFNIQNMSASAHMTYKVEKTATVKEEKEEKVSFVAVEMETAPASVIIPPRVEVYEGKTMEEVAEQLNRNLGGILAGHGDVIASHSIELGVDPYVAAAIMIHETGNGTSNIANNCYNFGGQKGYGCGAYKKYDTVDAGLTGIIDNLYKNYYAYGLNTIESIGHKYAESGEWPAKINWYVNKIKSN